MCRTPLVWHVRHFVQEQPTEVGCGGLGGGLPSANWLRPDIPEAVVKLNETISIQVTRAHVKTFA